MKKILEELKKIKQSQKTLELENRVECLILLNNKQFISHKKPAQYLLGVSLKSIDRWLCIYCDQRTEVLTLLMSSNKLSKRIQPQL